jgi:hypothetical protein
MEKMCPDKQLLSVYFDGELSSPWKEKMEQHLESCPECRGLLENYRQMSGVLKSAPSATEEALDADALIARAGERVWERLTESRRPARHIPAVRGGLWRRSVQIPLPFAAAAAAIIVFACALLITRQNTVQAPVSIPVLTEADDNENLIPAGYGFDMQTQSSNVGEVLRYLENDASSDIIIIKLPDQKQFNKNGEPSFLRAADYSGGTKY